MAVESSRDVSSPGDSSPIKLEGPCFHVHNPRKRAGLVSPPQLSDDDASCSSSSKVQVVEVLAPSKRQRQRQSRRRSFSATAGAVGASLSIDKLLKLLNVVELETSGFENNCLCVEYHTVYGVSPWVTRTHLLPYRVCCTVS